MPQPGLITINSIHTAETEDIDSLKLLREFKYVFKGLGSLWEEYHIDLNKAVPPVQHAPCHILIALKERLRQKIQELESKVIITKVEEPTAWISSLVAMVKPGKLRLCIDLKNLNKAIQQPKYQIPNLEEILPQVPDAILFQS